MDEDRFVGIGPVREGLIVVVYAVVDGETLRIISARKATAREAGMYGQYMGRSS